MVAPSQIFVNSQLFNATDGVTVVQADKKHHESKSQLLPRAYTTSVAGTQQVGYEDT